MPNDADDEHGLAWAESIHGDLVVVPKQLLPKWKLIERGGPSPGKPLVKGFLNRLAVGKKGEALVLLHQDYTTFVPLSSGGGFIVQAMDADRAELTDDDDAVYEALEAIDDSKWKTTDMTFVVDGGLLIFDSCVPDEDAIGEFSVEGEIDDGTFHVDVIDKIKVGKAQLRLVRFRPWRG